MVVGDGLRSPKGNVLRQLEGDAGDIDTQANELVSAAKVMKRAARTLQNISDGTGIMSEALSMDDVRESAGDVASDLRKAEIRYRMTGEALIAYASALETAQGELRTRIPDIQEKHRAVQTARSGAAQGWYADLQNPGAPAKSSSEQETAAATLALAEDELETAWSGFDTVFGVWEDAYNKAIDGIDDAFDKANNNDAWGEDFLAVLGYVGIALCVVALFCTGPIAAVIGAIGLAVAVLVVVINALKFDKGRGNWLDMGVAVASIIPFVRPLANAAKGIKTAGAAKATLASGKTTLRSSLKSTVRGRTRSGSRPGVPKTKARSSSQVTKIADKKATNLLDEFDKGNSIVNRVKMNVFGGGHSDVAAFGNFVRSKGADKVGREVLEWAAVNAPNKGVHIGGVLENATSDLADMYFLAEEHVPAFDEHVVSRFDQ